MTEENFNERTIRKYAIEYVEETTSRSPRATYPVAQNQERVQGDLTDHLLPQ